MAGLWSVLKYGSDTRSCCMLPACGRAPVRALSSGHGGGDSMVLAWVGPLYWIQWAGGHRRLHPRGRRNGPGDGTPSPGPHGFPAVRRACTERVRGGPHLSELAENRPHSFGAVSPSILAVEGALVVLGARWGAHSRRSGAGGRVVASGRSPCLGRVL